MGCHFPTGQSSTSRAPAQALPSWGRVDERPRRLASGRPVISAAARTRGAPRRRRTHTAGWARARWRSRPGFDQGRSVVLSSRELRGGPPEWPWRLNECPPPCRWRTPAGAQLSRPAFRVTLVEEVAAAIHVPPPAFPHRLDAPCRSLLLRTPRRSRRGSLPLAPHPHHRTQQPWRLLAPLSRPRPRC